MTNPIMQHLTIGGTTYDTVGAASVTQVVSSGTKIATVTIDGANTDLYAPSGGGVSMSTTTCTLGTSGWSSNSITVSATGVTSSNNVIVSPAPTSSVAYAAAGIVCTAQGTDTLTFTRTSANTSSITVNVLILS